MLINFEPGGPIVQVVQVTHVDELELLVAPTAITPVITFLKVRPPPLHPCPTRLLRSGNRAAQWGVATSASALCGRPLHTVHAMTGLGK